MSNQCEFDKSAFTQLISNFTGISTSKLDSFLKNNNITMIFEHPTAIGITQLQLKKLEQIKKLSSLYNNLKDNKTVYCMKSSTSAGEYFKNYFCGIKDKEKFVCAFLDTGNNIIATEVMNTGTVNEAPVYPREIVKQALMYDANSIMISHNHPGESLKPSAADIDLTKHISQAVAIVRIKLLDHIIVAGDRYFSFMENGIMPDIFKSINNCQASNSDALEEDNDMEI